MSFYKMSTDPKAAFWTNWSVTDTICGSWAGVTCDGTNTNVIGLNLSSHLLDGALPVEIQILSQLQTLDLSNNTITDLSDAI
jgi:hypothetical protein